MATNPFNNNEDKEVEFEEQETTRPRSGSKGRVVSNPFHNHIEPELPRQ